MDSSDTGVVFSPQLAQYYQGGVLLQGFPSKALVRIDLLFLNIYPCDSAYLEFNSDPDNANPGASVQRVCAPQDVKANFLLFLRQRSLHLTFYTIRGNNIAQQGFLLRYTSKTSSPHHPLSLRTQTCSLLLSLNLHQHLAVLFSGPPKPEVCWNSKS